MPCFFFAVVYPIHAAVFRIAEIECPRLFRSNKGGKRPARIPTPEEVTGGRVEFMRSLNKINEVVSTSSGRNPDLNLNKTWGDWLTTAQVALEISDEKSRKKPARS